MQCCGFHGNREGASMQFIQHFRMIDLYVVVGSYLIYISNKTRVFFLLFCLYLNTNRVSTKKLFPIIYLIKNSAIFKTFYLRMNFKMFTDRYVQQFMNSRPIWTKKIKSLTSIFLQNRVFYSIHYSPTNLHTCHETLDNKFYVFFCWKYVNHISR